ncbi:AI-2E family transporter [Candidatus Microgenomates bacterium]|nr:AI-2E family transporter [Candidatus Microgenomates bacterium]
MPRKIEVSHKTILFTFALIISIWLLIQIREIILLLFVSLILVSALQSPVEWLAQKRVPRPISILLIYFLIFIILGGGIGLLVPPLIDQTKKLGESLPILFDSVNRLFFYQLPTQEILKSFDSRTIFFGGDVFRYTIGFFGNIITIFTVFVFTFYLLLRWRNLAKILSSNFGQEERFTQLLNRIEKGLGSWLRGEVLLMIIIGLLAYIGLSLLRIPYALPLAIFAGFLEIVPLIGPIIGAIPAVIVALTISPLLALATAALYFVIQQLENNLIVPKLMQKAVGIDPLVTILALMIGAKLMGTLGALLAVPFFVMAKIILLDIFQNRKE